MKTTTLRFSETTLENIRTLGDGKILKLSLAKGKSLASHRTKDALTVIVLNGKVKFESAEQSVEMNRLDAALLEPAQVHAVEALEESVLLLVMLPTPTAPSAPQA